MMKPGPSKENREISSIEAELYFLIARFLSSGPCSDAAQALRKELEKHKLLPKRIDWEGREHERSFENLVELYRHVTSTHLLHICQRLGPLLDKDIKPSVCGVQSLLGSGSNSLLRTKDAILNPRWPPVTHVVMHHQRPLLPPNNLVIPNVGHVLKGREMSGHSRLDHTFSNHIYVKVALHARKLGHLAAVYCVAFDRTGKYIFTGADDALIKIWYAENSRLLATLRGHNSEITDIAVNYENTLLASGSCDKIIRVWCLRTKTPLAVLSAHTGMITSLQFCPQSHGENRILMSTGGDGCVCFWFWNVTTNKFESKPGKFIEKSRAGAQMLCSSFSPGGVFLATGSSDHVVRVYFVHGKTPEKICELEAHTERVDSICYCNTGERFVSGSCDGTARIWRYDRQEWKSIILNMATKLQPTSEEDKIKYGVTMVAWNADDRYVLTAVTDCTLKVWDSRSGKLLHILKYHEDEVFVLECSPWDPRVILSAGHDGHVILWDIQKGVKIKSFFNMIEGQGHGSMFDCKFSPDGLSFAATDSHGHMLNFGFGGSEIHKKIPQELFFHTDYRPLMRDANNYVLDEQTQQPPHLMPPPFLVDIDGNPYPPRLQKLVPGREHNRDDQLIPQMGVNEEGEQEVLGDVEPEAGGAGPSGHAPGGPPGQAPAGLPGHVLGGSSGHAPGGPSGQASIDRMIRELQRQQDNRIIQQGGAPLASPPPPGAQLRVNRSNSVGNTGPRVGIRRSGETEGVRQSLSNIEQRATQSEIAAWSRRIVVRELDPSLLSKNEEERRAHSEAEMRKFLEERKKKPSLHYPSTASTPKKGKGKKKVIEEPASPAQQENEQTATNRLVTRALYDTEEEEEDGSGSDLWNSSSDGESSEYSDWMGDTGNNLQPPKRTSQRKRKQRKISSSETEDIDSDYLHDVAKDEARDSTFQAKVPRPQRKKPAPKKKEPKPTKKTIRRQKIVKKMGGIQELPEEFRPSEWLTDTKPRKTPYVPQMGDEVMYFRQGHDLYLQAVVRKNAYKIDPNKNLPWHKMPSIREQELMRVVGIKYEVRPPRMVCLKLAFIDPATGKPTGGSISIKYHDMPDVIDFLVLRQNYDIAMQRKWKTGDRFRSMIDDAWWMGSIKEQFPFQEEHPDSMFQCFLVHWDNGETEKISPWDMEPIADCTGRPGHRGMPEDPGGGVPVTQDEIISLMYTPSAGEWPSCFRDQECDRIIRGMEMIMEHSVAEPFLTPVDLNVFPIYGIIIEYPMDLTTIKSRLENRFYRRVNALQFDVRYIETNAVTFNEAGTPIVKSAKILTEALLRFINDTDCCDPMSIVSNLTHGMEFNWGSSDSDSDTEDTADTRKRKRSDDELPETKKRKKTGITDPNAWKSQCRQLLETMLRCEDSEPFRRPVGLNELPGYFDIVMNPMDLVSVRQKLQDDYYDNPQDLCKDCRQVFTNSKLYNTNKRARIYTMTLRLSAMFEEQIRDIISGWKTAVKRSQKSPAPRGFSPRIKPSTSYSTRAGTSRDTKVSVPGPSRSTSALRNGRRSRFVSSTTEFEVDVTGPSSSRSVRVATRAAPSPAKKPVVESNHYDSETELETTDEEEQVKVSKRPQRTAGNKSPAKPSLTNGGSSKSYTTRAATGSIKLRRYCADGSFTDDDKNQENSHSSSSSSDSESNLNEKSRPRSSSLSSSSSRCSHGNSSGSDTESLSDYKTVQSAPTVKVPNHRRKPRLKANIGGEEGAGPSDSQRRPKRSTKQIDTYGNGSELPVRSTRNKGKRTIKYTQESDLDEDQSESGSDSEDSEPSTPVVTVSSRGRLRKMTPRARANLAS
ncbi:bromodomain and WD repeat-containing protein 3-like isoform X1 [Mytilus californianus]|uniref:bromodomain and WD repeat-containing protein 3-like isoform X1 n=1 Tax=Mytilus californianus TaxID=6549 RepID=UPI00224672CC|nr:bromodomain and WD repeat-containing protein 3-like isoform X1 [Mytilus californianus]